MELKAVLIALNDALEIKERLIEWLREENSSLTARLREAEKQLAENVKTFAEQTATIAELNKKIEVLEDDF